MLGNPVRGYIYAHDAPHPAGAFWVTAAFGQIDASHPTPHQGIDIGNGTCGFDILAMDNGIVREALKDAGTGAWIARYDLASMPGLRAGIAHMPSLEVSVGQSVARGQVIGHCGMSGASACHLHQGIKRNGVEFDWWPLLDQNSAGGDMLPIPGANYTRLANKKSTLKFNGYFRDERKNGTPLQPDPFPAGTVIYPVAYANDGSVPTGSQSGEWFACFLYVAGKGNMLGWFHSSLVNPLVDDVVVGGIPQSKYDVDIAALNARIAGMKKKVAAGAVDIADD